MTSYALRVYPTSTFALFLSHCDSSNAPIRYTQARGDKHAGRSQLGHFESSERLRAGLTVGQSAATRGFCCSQAGDNPVSPTLFSFHCVR